MGRRIVLLLCIWMMISTASIGQGLVDFSLGPKVGANYTDFISPKDIVNSNPALGYQAGVFGRVEVGMFYVQPELYYAVKGATIKFRQDGDQGGSSFVGGKINYNNLDVPVLLGLKVIALDAFNLRVMGGPVASFAFDIRKSSSFEQIPSADDYLRNTWGVQTGIGADIGRFTIDSRYEIGLSEINRFYDQRASVFQLSIGMKLF